MPVRSVFSAVRNRFRAAAPGAGPLASFTSDDGPRRAPAVFNLEQLGDYARTLAGQHALRERPGPDRLLPRLAENEQVLFRAQQLLADAARQRRRIAPAAEWLLDNFYLIDGQIRTARQHLPRSYSRELPQLRDEPAAGLPRVYDIAQELIAHVDGRLDAEGLARFMASYEEITPLRLGELWAIPIMLRLGLIENLRLAAERISAARLHRNVANLWSDRMLARAARAPGELVLVLADMVRAQPPLSDAFVAEFVRRLQGQRPALALPLSWLEQRLAQNETSVEECVQREGQQQAADQLTVSNSISSLRFLVAMDWREFVEVMSAVEQTLRLDPADVYSDMTFQTRDLYRHVVEEVARRTHARDEVAVARAAVDLARERAAQLGRTEREAHVGHFLIGPGRPALERRVRARWQFAAAVRAAAARLPLVLYLAGVLGTTATTATVVLLGGHQLGAPAALLALLALPVVVAASQLGVALVNWFITNAVPPEPLPRIEFGRGIPSEHRTVVVVPTMLTTPPGIEELLEGLEVRFLANRDENLHFALLTDFTDAPQEHMPSDADLLRRAAAGIATLNARHAPERRDVFFLFHRPRRWNEQEGIWMGWERKRGKLEEFNALLRGGDETRFSLIEGEHQILRRARCVITLDTDTQLPRDSARLLVGTLAHPLNRPRYDARSGRVTAGYTILQPRVSISLPSARRSWFAYLFAGEPGIDPYTRAVSDVYQDAFGQGSFIGKGIYDIDAFQQALAGRLPPNRILSHDLLEGAYARSGLVTDALLVEDYPRAYLADVRRRHRWIRGDWQIAAWLGPRVPGPDGQPVRNPISPLSRWKIFDNLRRSLVCPALLLALLLAWLVPGPAQWLTAAIAGLVLLPPLLGALTRLLGPAAGVPWRMHLRTVGRVAQRDAASALFLLASLPFETYMAADAITRTIRRVLVGGRLLEWQTASEADRRTGTAFCGTYRTMWVAPLAGAVLPLAVLPYNAAALPALLPFAIAWLLAPAAAWLLSRPLSPREAALDARDLELLRRVGRRTWRWFETFVGPADNHLPPDNYQQEPREAVAHRTSPTNVGLALLGNLAAHDLGYLSTGQFLGRTAATLETLRGLERYQGHLYNWYDTRTLQPLPPLYLSTVDSGNFVASLALLRAGLGEIETAPILPPTLLPGLEDTLRELVNEQTTPRQARPARASAAPVEVSRRGAGQAPPAAAGDGKTEQRSAPAEPVPAGQTPPVSPELRALLVRLQQALQVQPRTLSEFQALLQRLDTMLAQSGALVTAAPTEPGELAAWTVALHRQVQGWLDDLRSLAPWLNLPPLRLTEPVGSNPPLETAGDELPGSTWQRLRQRVKRLDQIPTLREIAEVFSEFGPVLERESELALSGEAELKEGETSAEPSVESPGPWLDALRAGSDFAHQRLAAIADLDATCAELADVSWNFLYDRSRRLFVIGYNRTDRRVDPSFYDLLASEARLASYLAIADGKLPQEHWFALSRALTTSDHTIALLSWSGSMFEYLMPLVFMPNFPDSLLDQTCRAVVRRQIAYGRERHAPWGVSESGYNATDFELNYQYRAFGVPGLGLKRGLVEDFVIAPYASALALTVAPHQACANLRRLAELGAFGGYGFYEAIDFTPTRVPRGRNKAIVRSWMAHHQGMTLLSVAHVLRDRPMQRRFAGTPRFRAIDLLLQERVPQTPPMYPHTTEVTEARQPPAEPHATVRRFTTPDTPTPEVHLLSNGRYHVMVTAAGGGFSHWSGAAGALAVTRWREDTTLDHYGTFCYLRDTVTGEFWANTHQPVTRPPDSYEVIFSQARAEFRRVDQGIETHTVICVSSENDVELRRITLSNRTRRRRTIELTTCAEVVLAPQQADAAHPAFSKLFVQTELVPARQAIVYTRRPRSSLERLPWGMHLVAVRGATARPPTFETDRVRFIGRGRSDADPLAMHISELSGTAGAVLDPIVAVRQTVRLEPDEALDIDVISGVAETRAAALALVDKYNDRRIADRVPELAWTHSQVLLRQLGLTEADAQLFGRLAGALLYLNPAHRAEPSLLARNRRPQTGLWGYGISGDYPIVLLRIHDAAEITLVRQLLSAHAYWRLKGLSVDLVIWNEEQSSYRQAVQDEIMGLIAAGPEAALVDRPGGVFVRPAAQFSEEDRTLLLAVARAIFSDTAGTLAQQLDRTPRPPRHVPIFTPTSRRPRPPAATRQIRRPDLMLFNGIGGFTQDGREYIVSTTREQTSPAPWANVLANPQFGAVITENGGAYTWFENAHEYRLTPWHNDPVTGRSGECFYIRDEETGHFWSPAPWPARGSTPYATRHGFGYTVFEHEEDEIDSEMWTCVAVDAPVRFIWFKIRNRSTRSRRISVTGFVEWVLGQQRSRYAPHIVTELDSVTGALFAYNNYNPELPDRAAFFDVSTATRSYTADRTEFLGRNGRHARPAALRHTRLSRRAGAGLDPAAALQAVIDLAPGQEREIAFTLGAGRSVEELRELVQRFRGTDKAYDALQNVWGYWNHTLGAVHVETPEPAVHFLVNGWLLYQTLAGRFYARSGFYQSGGAFGFRDQLQDALALLHTAPWLIREHLLLCASRQFRDGDVQHWWHPPTGRGVRTRISDDYLWLPYVTAAYVSAVGDTGVLDESAPFIEGRPLEPGEESYYDLPATSNQSAPLYEHCVRAIRYGLKFGRHGLPLMGAGDWNDGMNLVGLEGRGESVWLAFFLYDVLAKFAALARQRGDQAFADECQHQAVQLRENIAAHAWDGAWYRRAFFDDGQPLGSAVNPECQIDSLPQSWAVLSGGGQPDRARQALAQVEQRLVRREAALIQLFDPPFDQSPLQPGYIRGYVPGVRENGGQYTHAAIWAVMAFAESGQIERAWELARLLNPIAHGDTPERIATYKVEPYVVAADVYTNPQHLGRGGWTWYTGSAGWMYRLFVETLLGARLEVSHLRLAPRLPQAWPAIRLHYRFRDTFYHIEITNGGPEVRRVVVDGQELADNRIPLVDDRRDHHAQVTLG